MRHENLSRLASTTTRSQAREEPSANSAEIRGSPLQFCREPSADTTNDPRPTVLPPGLDAVPPAMHTEHHHMMYQAVHTIDQPPMRTTMNLDDTLLAEAQRLTGLRERTAVVHEALRALVERESARRLALLGGSEPQLEAPPRRRVAEG